MVGARSAIAWCITAHPAASVADWRQAARQLFLDIDNGFGLGQAGLQVRILVVEPLDFILERIAWGRFRSRRLRRQGGHGAFGPQLAPFGNLGGVDSFAAQDRPPFRCSCWVGGVLLDDPQALNRAAGGRLAGGAISVVAVVAGREYRSLIQSDS
jgi:hypothetical protein